MRALSRLVGVSAPTMGDYESGKTMPTADTLAKIAEALQIHAFEIDQYRFTITRREQITPALPAEQLSLDFVGEYAFSKATVRISPGRINISFDGATPIPALAGKICRLDSSEFTSYSHRHHNINKRYL